MGLRFVCGRGLQLNSGQIGGQVINLCAQLSRLYLTLRSGLLLWFHHNILMVEIGHFHSDVFYTNRELHSLRQVNYSIYCGLALLLQLKIPSPEFPVIGSFTVKSLYDKLQPQRPLDIVAASICRSSAPIKVQITMWLALQERLLTIVFLAHHNICPTFVCWLRKLQPESMQNLECPFTLQMWNTCKKNILSWLPSIRELWANWKLHNIRTTVQNYQDTTVLVVVWSIWWEWNSCIFQRKGHPHEAVTGKVAFYVKLRLSHLLLQRDSRIYSFLLSYSFLSFLTCKVFPDLSP